MKRITLLLTAIVLACASADAQSLLERLGQRAKNAAENNVGNQVEQGVNDLLNGKLGKKKDKKDQEQEAAQPSQAASQSGNASISWSAYDFVSGDEIIFEDTMENEKLGEFPSRWDLFHGEAQITDINGSKVICLSQAGGITPLFDGGKTYLTEECTVEYDIFIRAEEPWNAQFGGQDHGWADWMHLRTYLSSGDKILEDRGGFSMNYRVVGRKGEPFNPTIVYEWETPSGEVRNGQYELKNVATLIHPFGFVFV